MCTYREGGAAYISDLIRKAIANGERRTVVQGNWLVEKAILLPSDFTLLLDGCHLRQAEGCFDNLFRNEHCGTEIGHTLQGTDRNIRILGKNGAVLDGGVYNGLSERNAGKEGRLPIWVNNMILFANVDGFEISGIRCINQRWWAMNFIFCRHGRLTELEFCSSDLWVDDNGAQHHGLQNCRYDQILVKNSDGIDLRQGCHDILIEQISGFTEDDTVALTALQGRVEKAFFVEGLPTDIAYVTVRNVESAAYCSNVRLLTQGELSLHHITIEDVKDTSEASPHLDRGVFTVKLGDADCMYGSRPATEEEFHHITVRHVYSRAQRGAIHLAGAIGALTVEDVLAEQGTLMYDDHRIS